MNNQIVNYRRVESAIGYLTEHFKAQPGLDEVAHHVHLSPYHFQRIFLDWVGISPKKFLQYLSLDYLRGKIQETTNVMEAAEEAGLSSQSRVYDLFVNIEAVTPAQFKEGGIGLEICYGYHPSPFGMCFIAVAERGVCALKFIDEEKRRDEFQIFSERWRFATLIHKPELTQEYVRKIFRPLRPAVEGIRLLVQGTNFQLKVWEALLKIPFGAVASFEQIAGSIGRPEATRAVGQAVAANSILYLIPCHRIICKDGTMGDYHWGRVRKQAMIGWEMTRNE